MNEQRLLAQIFGEKYVPSEKDLQMEGKNIRLKYCSLCGGFYVECPRCGNNCCNAGAGQEKDGGKCIMCMKSYELQDALNKYRGLIEELLLNGRTYEDREKHKPLNMRNTI